MGLERVGHRRSEGDHAVSEHDKGWTVAEAASEKKGLEASILRDIGLFEIRSGLEVLEVRLTREHRLGEPSVVVLVGLDVALP